MARGSKKEVSEPEVEERARLRQLAFSSNVLSNKPVKLGPSAALAPSKTVVKHHGKDILRKSQRKNRYLFSFPGLLGPISGGKIGDLKDLGTKNPILYLDFPQGQMKLFGTIVYPKNRYLTLQFSKGGKNVTCEDYFDNMIVFSDAWWIGKKEDNPEELELRFPTELNMENQEGYDFKGGVGSVYDGKQGLGRLTMKHIEQVSPNVNVHLDDEATDSSSDSKELVEVTPTRQSARTSGKTFNFAEASSGDDFNLDGEETPEEDDKVDTETRRHAQQRSSSLVAFEVDGKDIAEQHPTSGRYDLNDKVKDPSADAPTSLVQTTLSSLFKKVEEKEVGKTDTSKVSKHMTREKKIRERESVYGRKSGKAFSTKHTKKKNGNPMPMTKSPDLEDSTQVESDEIEEFSSICQDKDDSDEDWTVKQA